jgi:hypothetical protein
MAAVIVESEDSCGDSACIGTLSVSLLEKRETQLCAFYPYCVQIFSIIGTKLASFNTSNRIIAFNSVLSIGSDIHWLLILTELNDLYVLSLKKTISNTNQIDILIIKHFKFSDILLKKKESVDSENLKKIVVTQKCFIKVDPSSRFIIIHSTRGFLIIIELKPSKRELFKLASINQPPKEIKKTPALLKIDKYKVFEKPEVFWINNDVVFDLQILQSENIWWISILSRNIELDYNLKFYRLQKISAIDFKLFKTITSIETIPNFVIPLKYCLFYIFFNYHVIYPLPMITLKCNDKSTNLDYEEDSGYVIHELSFNSGLNKIVKSYSKIDNNTILLFATDSGYYKIDLLFNYESDADSIELSNRTRSNYSAKKDAVLNLIKWEQVKLKTNLSYSFIHDYQIFNESTKFYSFNKYSQFYMFEITNEIVSNDKMISDGYSKKPLPVTALKTNKGLLTYTSGNMQYSHFESPDFQLDSEDEMFKDHINLEEYTVILSEFHTNNYKVPNENITNEKIDVYSQTGENIASYALEENVKVLSLLSLDSFKAYLPNGNDFLVSEVKDIEMLFDNSFIVTTSSGNRYDYENDEDFIYRKRTEILLFIIDNERNLQLKTISVLKIKIDSISQLDSRTLLFWGPQYCALLGLELYREEEGLKQLQLKFKKINERSLNMTTISIIKRLNFQFWLLIDPFIGMNILRIDPDTREIFKNRMIFEWNLITALDVFSEDLVVLGDVLGNIFMLNINYKNPRLPVCEIFSKFNVQYGSVACISCYQKNEFNDENSIKICSAGTSDGLIITIHAYEKLTPLIKREINNQNKLILKNSLLKIENIDKTSSTILKDLKSIKVETELYFELIPLLQERFVKTTSITDQTLESKNDDVYIIFK